MNPRAKRYLLTFVIIDILLVSAFLGRGWIRKTFLPHYASYFAKRSLEKSYHQAHESIKQPLKELGITLNEEVRTDCDLSGAKGLQTSIYCSNGSWSPHDSVVASDEYIQTFKQESAQMEQKILEQGWTKTWNAAQPINELFDNPENDVSIGVNYEKSYGKNLCGLHLFYNAYEKNPSKLHYGLSCNRYIYYLGDPD